MDTYWAVRGPTPDPGRLIVPLRTICCPCSHEWPHRCPTLPWRPCLEPPLPHPLSQYHPFCLFMFSNILSSFPSGSWLLPFCLETSSLPPSRGQWPSSSFRSPPRCHGSETPCLTVSLLLLIHIQSSATSAWNSVWLRVGASRVFIGRSQRGREAGREEADCRQAMLSPPFFSPFLRHFPAAFPIVNLSGMNKIRVLS